MTAPNRALLAALGAAAVAALLAGCGGTSAAQTASQTTTQTGAQAAGGSGTSTKAATANGGCTVVSRPRLGPHQMPKPKELLAKNKVYDVTMVTNCGSFTIRIDQAQSPHTAASFVTLVQHGFFDHTVFHRIVPGFVIQGGDPTGTGTGGPGYTTVDTPPAGAAYTHGVVAMAKTSTQPAGTSGSQFFIVTVKNANLPPDYAIVGEVTSGLNVVDRIGRHGDAAQQPTMVIEIEHATVKIR